MPRKNEQNRTKIDDLVAKTKFGDRKNYDSTSADIVLEIVEICPNDLLCSIFYSIPNLVYHIGLKLVAKTIFSDRKS